MKIRLKIKCVELKKVVNFHDFHVIGKWFCTNSFICCERSRLYSGSKIYQVLLINRFHWLISMYPFLNRLKLWRNWNFTFVFSTTTLIFICMIQFSQNQLTKLRENMKFWFKCRAWMLTYFYFIPKLNGILIRWKNN